MDATQLPTATNGGGTKQGYVDLMGGAASRIGLANFYVDGMPRADAHATNQSCHFSSSGLCQINDCTAMPGSASYDYGPLAGAGTITATVGAQSLVMPRNSAGSYQTSVEGFFWNDGDPVSVSASGSGDGVPAFTATVMAPPEFVIRAPVVGDSYKVELPNRSAIPIEWDPGAGDVEVELVAGSPLDHSVTAICKGSFSSGSLTLPAEAIAALPAGDADVLVIRSSVVKVAAGDWQVAVSAITSAMLTLTVPN